MNTECDDNNKKNNYGFRMMGKDGQRDASFFHNWSKARIRQWLAEHEQKGGLWDMLKGVAPDYVFDGPQPENERIKSFALIEDLKLDT